jgi:hypothetical protein
MARGDDTLQRLGRLGLVARGLLYAVVGVLAFNVARGSSRQADRQGALRAVGGTTVGRWLLVLVAVGFAGYALWRLAEATLRPGDRGVASRLASAARAVLYTGFCVTTLSFVVTQHSENADRREQDVTAHVLGWPGGRYVVGAAGLALIAVGVGNAWRALTGHYRKHLKEEEIPRATLRWLKPVAYAGLAARMVAFCLVGAFLVQSAVTYDPRKAHGLDGALRVVARTAYGEPLIVLVGIGLVAFGGWCWVQARYRDVLGT